MRAHGATGSARYKISLSTSAARIPILGKSKPRTVYCGPLVMGPSSDLDSVVPTWRSDLNVYHPHDWPEDSLATHRSPVTISVESSQMRFVTQKSVKTLSL